MQNMEWLPLTEYALRSGVSISTLRRKIKSNAIDYKMEEGRYLIRFEHGEPKLHKFVSDDRLINNKTKNNEPKQREAKLPPKIQVEKESTLPQRPIVVLDSHTNLEENDLKWRALEARVSGMSKKMDFLSEQLAELKMLVKIFEERLDQEKF